MFKYFSILRLSNSTSYKFNNTPSLILYLQYLLMMRVYMRSLFPGNKIQALEFVNSELAVIFFYFDICINGQVFKHLYLTGDRPGYFDLFYRCCLAKADMLL